MIYPDACGALFVCGYDSSVDVLKYLCRRCRHPFYEHRESTEWRLLNPRRKRNLTGCTHAGCDCSAADDSHVTRLLG